MKRSLAIGVGAAAGVFAWTRVAERRNNRLVRPPVLDPGGKPYALAPASTVGWRGR